MFHFSLFFLKKNRTLQKRPKALVCSKGLTPFGVKLYLLSYYSNVRANFSQVINVKHLYMYILLL